MPKIIREYPALRRGTEHVLAVRHCVGQQRGMERIAGGKLESQFVVIRQIGVVVVAKRAKSRGIELVGHRIAGQREAVHLERTIFLLINIKMTLIPARSEILSSYSLRMEQMAGSAANQREQKRVVVSSIDLVVGDTMAGRIGAKLAEVAVKAAIFLPHKNDVLDRLQSGAGADSHRCLTCSGVTA